MTRVLDSYELSPLQVGMLFHALREQDPTTYVEQIVVTLREPLDAGRLLEAWDRLVDRHAVLRTRFRWRGLAQPVQEVIDGARMPVEQFEHSDGLERLIDGQRARGFDLEQAPLMRLALVRGGEGEQTMVWTLHHMLLDGHGRTLLLQELFARYQGAAGPAEPRPYRDYIEWLRGLDRERAKDYWQRALAGLRAPTPLAVASGPIGDGHAVHEWRLSAELTRALRQRARAARITLNVLLQGAWALLLHRYSGVPDVVFGVTRACRASALEGAAGIVGPLINTVPLRVRVDPAAELGAWLEGLREPQLELRDYEHTPLVDVQRWSEVPRGTPLFETLFVFAQHTLEAQLRALGGAWSTRGFRNVGNTHYPLALAAYGDEKLLLQLQYSRRRFADDVAQRMAGHLQTLLEGMAADPRAKLRDLPLLTAAERHQIVTAWNETRAPYPPARCVHELVEAQARLRPDALAAQDGTRRLAYRELDERAERLAARLRKRGVQPGALVAVRLKRSVDMPVALLAVWKAGAAYVPIDPDYPAERVRFMLEDSRASVVLTEQHLADLEDEPLTASQTSLPERLAYVIYTSGSTGAPKGVPITHRSLFNLICWHREAYDVGPHDRATQVAGPAFDGAVWEIWPYLAAGASVHVPGERTRLDPSLLVRWLVERRITLAFLPTPLVEAALREPWPSACTLRALLTGGDKLNQGPPSGLPFRLVNHYGPTENTVVSTFAEVSPNERVPSIGRPLPNTQAYVVDAYGQPVPVGVPGELLVGGAQLSPGYWNRPDLTAAQFIPHPFSDEPGARVYRTGDRVRWLPDGNLEFLGRADDQVKIRGYRVELGEIESVLAELPGVRQAAVSVHESDLVAYLVGEADLAQVRAHLRGKLPDYMVPGEFVRLSRMPFTPNGKLDRKALPAPERTAAAEFVAPVTPTEQALAELWQRVLRIERIGAKDNFFESGGHSLLAMQLVGGVRERFGVALPIKNLFERPILADLAQAIDALSWLERSKAPPAHATAREEALL